MNDSLIITGYGGDYHNPDLVKAWEAKENHLAEVRRKDKEREDLYNYRCLVTEHADWYVQCRRLRGFLKREDAIREIQWSIDRAYKNLAYAVTKDYNMLDRPIG